MASETVNSDSSDVEQESTENQETVDMRILDPDTIDLDLNHGRIGKIENLEPLTQLETLCLRWNMIKKIENLSTLGSTLTELELYDNQITVLENLDSLVNLEILDVSHNRLRKIQGLGMVLKGFILDMHIDPKIRKFCCAYACGHLKVSRPKFEFGWSSHIF